MKVETVRRILRHANRLGPRAGIQAARMLGQAGRAVRVQVPGLAHRLWVRAGTSDVETFEEIFLARQYDLPFSNFEPRNILDLGANVGFASVYFATRWPEAKILAVEPVEQNFTWLEKNTRPWLRVSRVKAAVWARAAQLQIVNPCDASNAFRVGAPPDDEDGSGDTVAGLTIPELMEHHECSHWDLVKMDVEGAETEILRDGAEWLDHVSVFVIELHDRTVPGCTEALCAALQGRHYRMEIVGSNLAFDFR